VEIPSPDPPVAPGAIDGRPLQGRGGAELSMVSFYLYPFWIF
jgi:hypothetical protein